MNEIVHLTKISWYYFEVVARNILYIQCFSLISSVAWLRNPLYIVWVQQTVYVIWF